MAQNEYLVDGADMTTVADAIREKGGTTAPLSFPAGMAEAVRNIQSGGDLTLGITGAQVEQIAKITAVDTDGKPTKWEPVDIPSGGGDISLGLTAATVGQTVKVKAVDASGVPTAWEAVDGVGIWEIIADYTAAEAASWLNINKDTNGNAFSLRKVKVEIILPNAVGGGLWYLYLSSGTQFFGTTSINATGNGPVKIQCEAESDDIVAFATKRDKNLSSDLFTLDRSADYTTITAVRLGNWSDLTFPAGAKVLVKGVRA